MSDKVDLKISFSQSLVSSVNLDWDGIGKMLCGKITSKIEGNEIVLRQIGQPTPKDGMMEFSYTTDYKANQVFELLKDLTDERQDAIMGYVHCKLSDSNRKRRPLTEEDHRQMILDAMDRSVKEYKKHMS